MTKKTLPIIITTAFLLAGCSAITVEEISSTDKTASVTTEASFELPTSTSEDSEVEVATSEVDDSAETMETTEADEEEAPAEPELPDTITFVDVYKESYTVDFKKDWALHNYKLDNFVHDGDKVYYQGDEDYTSRFGIDVSHHQKGNIDWQKVADSGVEFVIVRVGYRGYGINSGWIKEDEYAASNIKKARAAGLDVGTYFFSQAINEEEALEEAEFVIDFFKRNHLSPEDIALPVVFDPESIRKDDARTDSVSGEQFTKNTRVFCDKIKEAGFQPMVYSNMLWEAYMLDLKELSDIPVWYADYEDLPQTPYDFVMWQYSESIHVPGIPGNMDGNVLLIPNN